MQFKAFFARTVRHFCRAFRRRIGLTAPENGHALPLARVPIIFKNPSHSKPTAKPSAPCPSRAVFLRARLIKLRLLFIVPNRSTAAPPLELSWRTCECRKLLFGCRGSNTISGSKPELPLRAFCVSAVIRRHSRPRQAPASPVPCGSAPAPAPPPRDRRSSRAFS